MSSVREGERKVGEGGAMSCSSDQVLILFEIQQQLSGLRITCYQNTQAFLRTKVHDLLKGRVINQCLHTLAATAH